MSLAHLIDAPELPENLRLRRRIGSGAAGNCFLVTDITGQALALKIVSEKWEERELESIRALRKIPSHPALAQILGSGKLSDGRFYYTMELADNAGTETEYQADTLAYRIKNRVIPLPEILQIISAVASGAEHLHRHGVFHGDIKPENILFVNGSPKLGDFGTLSSGHSGTAGFYPENPVSGADRDCYALGMTLYCAWSGRDASSFPDPPDSYDPKEWRRVRKIYLQACNPAVRHRFSSASALIAALNEAAQPRRHVFTRKRLLITGTLFLLLILFSGVAVLFFRTKEEPLTPQQQQSSSPFFITYNPRDFVTEDNEEEYEARKQQELHEIWRRGSEEWIQKHPKAIKELAEYGVTITLTPDGQLEIHDPEYKENGGIYRTHSDWYFSVSGKRYLEVKRWMRKNPGEIEKMKTDGITFFPDPKDGLEYTDTRNGLQGVGSLSDLLAYWKDGPLFYLKKKQQP